MIKEQINERLYHIYPSSPPETIELDVYRGDYFTFTLQGFNVDDTPFDFSAFSDFKAQIRVGDPRNRAFIYEFQWTRNNEPGDEFVLGKSDVELEEYDELSIITDKGFDVSIPYPLLWMDVEGIMRYDLTDGKVVDEKNTLIKIRLLNEPDVTRD